jgi:hypothetical protein
MARDRLEQFRRKEQQPPAQRPSAAPASQSPLPEVPHEKAMPEALAGEVLEPLREFNTSGQEIYRAFRPSSRREDHLEIRLAADAWQLPRFFDMQRIIINQRLGTEIVLLFPEFGVFITGRNLLPVLYVIKAHRCAFIEAYHSGKFAPVEDENVPFISSLELKSRGSEEAPKLEAGGKGSNEKKGGGEN